MSTLTEFLLDRIAEDEAAAKDVTPLGHNYDMGGRRQDERWYVSRLRFSSMDGAASSDQDEAASRLFARHDPARVLAKCEAERRIASRCAPTLMDEWPTREWSEERDVRETVLRDLAAVYADHPDYRDEWKP